jgi:hypothetical protein
VQQHHGPQQQQHKQQPLQQLLPLSPTATTLQTQSPWPVCKQYKQLQQPRRQQQQQVLWLASQAAFHLWIPWH